VCGSTDDAELPEIGESELDDALAGIGECAEAFDFDSIDSIMQQLEGYRMPDDKRDMMEKLRKFVSAVDRDAIVELLKGESND